ncbi:hypothetical protein GIB67_037082 [Kingdonia uniflora]|uniref:K Homology domain-containing protein n=1 Tax=Kingdonia uniflora TaxID=39325 RepID=A0A7J7LI29_9MAGN|nr:hypothetical protein GIB67_037082 [Kingdonia uniflora]
MSSKRAFDRNPSESNRKWKWKRPATQLKITPSSIVFRVLCPVSKSGSVIGKYGTIVTQIRQETGAKVRVEEPVSGDDERVIVIVGSENERDDEDEDEEEKNQSDENNQQNDTTPVEVYSSAQKALLRVFERIVLAEEPENAHQQTDKAYFVRLLVLSSQVGCLLGKGGTVIKQMAAETGAQIRILPRDKLPQCVTPSDELLQITGELDAVTKALQSVSQQLMVNPHRDHDSTPAIKSTGPSTPPSAPISKSGNHSKKHHFPAQGTPFTSALQDRSTVVPSNPKFRESGILSTPTLRESSILGRGRPPLELTFSLICHNEKVGGIIGKGGSIVRLLQNETGCDIKILEGDTISEDRIIVITGPAHPSDRISAVEDAVLRVQSRLVMGIPIPNENVVIARLLVSHYQIGCLIGHSGSILSDMRRLSGAHIRVLAKNLVPTFVSVDEEVVQAMGQFESVQEALLQITSRLRHHHFGDTFPSNNNPLHPSFPDQVSRFPPFMGRREPSPPRMFPNMGPPFNKFSSIGGMPLHGRMYPQDDRPAFAHNAQRPGFSSQNFGRDPTSAPWEPQGIIDGRGSMGMPNYPGGAMQPQRRAGGFRSGTNPAIITSTVVEVAVPQAVVPSIYGEGGSSLKQLRQISGAKITIGEPIPGATETKVVISGTPEETHAAQSLLQAFVMSGSDSP